MSLLSILFLSLLSLLVSQAKPSDNHTHAQLLQRSKDMFYHGYDSYMTFAFPHDELRPLSKTGTDTLPQLGSNRPTPTHYQGIAMTLIDSLDTLAVLGNFTEFVHSVNWVLRHVSFDQDVRVSLFEVNIRVLGGLLSAHFLALEDRVGFTEYSGGLLDLARDLGDRLLPAFETENGIPFAWVNLQRGVEPEEISRICTAEIGTLLVEFGTLSVLTEDFRYYDVAFRALMSLWELRDEGTGLFGNTLDRSSGKWTNRNAGIGAGLDSFYEYLVKAWILFGEDLYLEMFQEAYESVQTHLYSKPWYHEADMVSGRPSHIHFNSLQAFWPGLQTLTGDLEQASDTFEAFYSLWQTFGALPERYLLNSNKLHNSERYYPLRPELVESCFLLYRATKDEKYLTAGSVMLESLERISRVEGGFASVKDVGTLEKEDRMQSFFLAELCKYMYLLFDEDNELLGGNFVFSTEGHIFPVTRKSQEMFRNRHQVRLRGSKALATQCAVEETQVLMNSGQCLAIPTFELGSAKEELNVYVKQGAFHIEQGHELTIIRNVGGGSVQIFNRLHEQERMLEYHSDHSVSMLSLVMKPDDESMCKPTTFVVAGATFGPEMRGMEKYYPMVLVRPWTGCSKLGSDVRGKIAVVFRGDCSFVDKVSLLQSQGAVGVIVVNHLEKNHIFVMGGDDVLDYIKIPSVMVHDQDGTLIRSCLVSSWLGQTAVMAKFQLRTRVTFPDKDSCDAEHSSSRIGEIPIPYLYGRFDSFFYQGIGGWTVKVHKDGDVHHLSVIQ